MADIRIDQDGLWTYRGVEMTRRDIVGLFYRHLKRNESGGYFLEMGSQRCGVDVEDTAYVVWAVHWVEGAGPADERAWLLLSDDSLEPLEPDTLRIGAEGIPYCRVKNRSFVARFSRTGYYQLADRMQHDSLRDAYFIVLQGTRHYVAGHSDLKSEIGNRSQEIS